MFFHSLSELQQSQLIKLTRSVFVSQHTWAGPLEPYGPFLFALRQTLDLHAYATKTLLQLEVHDACIYVLGYSNASQIDALDDTQGQYVLLKTSDSWTSHGSPVPTFGMSNHILSTLEDAQTSLHTYMCISFDANLDLALRLCRHFVWPAVKPYDTMECTIKTKGMASTSFRVGPWTETRVVTEKVDLLDIGVLIERRGPFQYTMDSMDHFFAYRASGQHMHHSCIYQTGDTFDSCQIFALSFTKVSVPRTPDRPQRPEFEWVSTLGLCVQKGLHVDTLNSKLKAWIETVEEVHQHIRTLNSSIETELLPGLFQDASMIFTKVADVHVDHTMRKTIAINMTSMCDDEIKLRADFRYACIDEMCKHYGIETREVLTTVFRVLGQASESPKPISPVPNFSPVPSFSPAPSFVDPYLPYMQQDPFGSNTYTDDLGFVQHYEADPVARPVASPYKRRRVAKDAPPRKYKKHDVPTTHYTPRYRNDGTTDVARAWLLMKQLPQGHEHALPNVQRRISEEEYNSILKTFREKAHANRFAKPEKDPDAERRNLDRKISYMQRDFLKFGVIHKETRQLQLSIADIEGILEDEYGPLLRTE